MKLKANLWNRLKGSRQPPHCSTKLSEAPHAENLLRTPTILSPELRALSGAALSFSFALRNQYMNTFWKRSAKPNLDCNVDSVFCRQGDEEIEPTQPVSHVSPSSPGLLSSPLIPSPRPSLQPSLFQRGKSPWHVIRRFAVRIS